MKISGFRLERIDNRLRASATVMWEDSQRDTAAIFFETDDPGGLSCNPHAFLLACTIPAMHYGERRIYLDAELCPLLKDGLATAVSILHDWYYRDTRAPLQIEAKALIRALPISSSERAGFFFSGGVDSYTTLRLNRTSFPAGHPYSITDGILVFGLELDDPEKFDHVRRELARSADECGISFMPLYTNVYLPYRQEDARHGFHFWEFEYQGSALAAIAHSLVTRLSVVSISATTSHRTLSPYGSHALIDPNYSSADMRILHAGLALSRLEKTRLIAEWGLPLRYLRVCNQYLKYGRGALNCGECEKCLRTKLALLVLGKLHDVGVFSNADVTAELIDRRVRISTAYQASCYEELLLPLRQGGHRRLARLIQRKLAESRRWGPMTAPAKIRRLCRRALHKLATVLDGPN